jgi:hypothetical protein
LKAGVGHVWNLHTKISENNRYIGLNGDNFDSILGGVAKLLCWFFHLSEKKTNHLDTLSSQEDTMVVKSPYLLGNHMA